MKKLLLSALSLVACMAVNAQVVYFNDFSSEELREGLTIINANDDYYGGDANTWQHNYQDGKFCMYNRWTMRGIGNCDDWLITEGIELDPANIYKFSMMINGSSDTQTLTVELGTAATAEAMTQNIMPAFTFNISSWESRESEEFSVEEAGTYYIGIHDISDEYCYNTFVTDVQLEIVGQNNTPTAISTINAAAAGRTFSIDGRQVNKVQSGLYIQNGKKVLVK